MNKPKSADRTAAQNQIEKKANGTAKFTKEIKYQESPMERALKLSSDEAIARAIRDLINRDQLN